MAPPASLIAFHHQCTRARHWLQVELHKGEMKQYGLLEAEAVERFRTLLPKLLAKIRRGDNERRRRVRC
jgi:hypothetical protein